MALSEEERQAMGFELEACTHIIGLARIQFLQGSDKEAVAHLNMAGGILNQQMINFQAAQQAGIVIAGPDILNNIAAQVERINGLGQPS